MYVCMYVWLYAYEPVCLQSFATGHTCRGGGELKCALRRNAGANCALPC